MSILLSAIDKRIWQTNGLTGVNCCLRNLFTSFSTIKLSCRKIIILFKNYNHFCSMIIALALVYGFFTLLNSSYYLV